jgi:hypothetical protein
VHLALKPGAHACHIFTNLSEQNQVTLPLCRSALRNNECVLLALPENSIDEWQVELQAFGVDVQDARDRGALAIKPVRRPSPRFNAIRQVRELWRMVEPLLHDFDAVYLIREVPWSSDLAPSVEDLCQFEAAKDLLFADTGVRSICQYDLVKHPPAAIHTALRTHPIVIFNGKMNRNPYYEAPTILEHEPWAFGTNADAAKVESLLARFR